MNWTESKIRVRYQETDKMGVVYHANYFVWFEVGRAEMIRTIGVTYKEMEEKGVLLPIIDASCSYKNSAKYDDEIIIRTKVASYNGFRLEFTYEAIRVDDQKLLAVGNTKHVWVDKNYKPVRLEKVVPEIERKLLALIQE